MTSLLHLFCHVDDFCQEFLPTFRSHLLPSAEGKRRRQRARSLSESEIMTILIAFHPSHYRDFKAFSTEHVCPHWRAQFPGLVSYHRFMEFVPSVRVPLLCYRGSCLGTCTGISFVDSTPLVVCHNRRIGQHKVFAGAAQRGKSSTGWFFGFKLHLVLNDCGELLSIALTPGNVNDRQPVPQLTEQIKRLFGKLFGDKGYISQPLREQLLQVLGIELVTKVKKNMKNRLMRLSDRLLLRKRAIIETVVDQLKNVSQIEHSRHRSPTGFLVNVVCGLVAYCHQPKKPSLDLGFNPAKAITA
jgi:transposase